MNEQRCTECFNFQSDIRSEMERHVAIVHCLGHCSTIECNQCQKKFFDNDHFKAHLGMKTCSVESEPKRCELATQIQRAFESLVDQMMKPIPKTNTSISITNGQEQAIDGEKSVSNPIDAREELVSNSAEPPSIDSGHRSPDHVHDDDNSRPSTLKIASVFTLSNRKRSFEQAMAPTEVEGRKRRISMEPSVTGEPLIQDHHQIISKPSNEMIESIQASAHMENHQNPVEAEEGVGLVLNGSTSEHVANKEISAVITKNIQPEAGSTFNLDLSKALTELNLLCDSIVQKRQVDGRITCKICNFSLVSVVEFSDTYFAHARHHTGPPYRCNLCDFTNLYEWEMRTHLIAVHASSQNDFLDSTRQHVQELKIMLHECFDHTHTKGYRRRSKQEESALIVLDDADLLDKDEDSSDHHSNQGGTSQHGLGDAAAGIRFKKRISSSLDMQLRNDLLAKVKRFIKDGKLNCQLCSRPIVIVGKRRDVDKRSIFEHAMVLHLKMPLLECGECQMAFKTFSAVLRHTESLHGGKATIVNRTNERIEEISDTFLTCYDLERDNGSKKTDIQKVVATRTDHNANSGTTTVASPEFGKKAIKNFGSGNECAFEPPICSAPDNDQLNSEAINRQMETLGQSESGFEKSALLEYAFKCQTCDFLTVDEMIMENHVRKDHSENS